MKAFVVVVLMLFTSSAVADVLDLPELVRICKLVERRDSLSEPEMMEAMRCISWIEGYLAGRETETKLMNRESKVCLPDNETVGQLVSIFVGVMDRHAARPQKLPLLSTLDAFFRAAYPCQP